MAYKNRYAFIALFEYAEDGIAISFPDLPGCYPCADTDEEAFRNAQEALGLHLWGMEQDGETIPPPSALKDIELPEGAVPVLIDVFMPVIRDRAKTRFVKKTLSLPAWLATRADQDGVNCSRLFQNALMDYLGVDEPSADNFKHPQ